ncbi:outer membrane channel protein TolC [Thalassotalea maritima]|uniref:outer membrane channel protein TolC n=1 Tax=Thalassotalea maritima TaxID=3242416 RepID=UPI0035287315
MTNKFNSVVAGLVLAGISSLASAQDLKDSYQLALQNDPTVLRAEAQVKASKELVEQARSLLLPQVNGAASYTMSQTDFDAFSQDDDVLRLGVNLNMDVYNHSSWLGLDIADKQAHQFDINYQFVKQQMITRVTEAYFDVLAAMDTLEFARAEKNPIERQLEQTKQRFSVGLTAITDVHEAQAQYDNSVANEISAQNDVYTAEEVLREITGTYPRNLAVLNTERFSAVTPSPASAEQWQQTAETNNLQLINQKVSVDIAKENIDLAQSGHYPTLALSGSVGTSNSDRDCSPTSFCNSLNGADVDDSSIGLSLNVPIYSGGRTSSLVRQAQQNYVVASQDMQLTYRGVVRGSRIAYNTIVATISSIKALEQSVISAESALKATEAGFEVGTRTIVDVLDRTQSLYNAKRNLSNARYRYIINMLRLKETAGTISDQDVLAINQGLVAQ